MNINTQGGAEVIRQFTSTMLLVDLLLLLYPVYSAFFK